MLIIVIPKRAVEKADQFRKSNGKVNKKKTTAGWDMEIEWKDESTSWLSLKEVKETNSVEVAHYAIVNHTDAKPAFDWWVREHIKHQKQLIKMLQKHAAQTGYKFGICIPYAVVEAMDLDKAAGNTLWYDAIMKEMSNVRVEFDFRGKGESAPVGYKHIRLQMIFDIKMDFTQKAHLIAGGQDPPSTMTYSSVVSRDSV